eukprot:scaffold133803_cov105-Phaeocystis_antarctica.AAC.1
MGAPARPRIQAGILGRTSAEIGRAARWRRQSSGCRGPSTRSGTWDLRPPTAAGGRPGSMYQRREACQSTPEALRHGQPCVPCQRRDQVRVAGLELRDIISASSRSKYGTFVHLRPQSPLIVRVVSPLDVLAYKHSSSALCMGARAWVRNSMGALAYRLGRATVAIRSTVAVAPRALFADT